MSHAKATHTPAAPAAPPIDPSYVPVAPPSSSAAASQRTPEDAALDDPEVTDLRKEIDDLAGQLHAKLDELHSHKQVNAEASLRQHNVLNSAKKAVQDLRDWIKGSL